MTQATETIFSSLTFELESHYFTIREKDVIYSLETSMHHFPHLPVDLIPLQEAHNLQRDGSVLSFLCRLSLDCVPTQCLPDFYLTYKYCLFSIPVYSRTLSCIPLATFTDNTVALNNTLSEWAADAVFNCESDWL